MSNVRTVPEMRRDALAIWRAGVAAVDASRLVLEFVRVAGRKLHLGDESIELSSVRKIEVIGAGKAGAGMAAGLEAALGTELLAEKQVSGWINVPADCLRPLSAIHLHAARPAGVNEPRPEGVAGAEEILRRVAALGPDDLCVCLISGGGSALLPAPIEGISLADKLAVTRFLSGAGATINELNAVRSQLSRMKGGGLARATRAGRLVTLILSDVLGDPLDVIASGPTTPSRATASDALDVLQRFAARGNVPESVFALLEAQRDRPPPGDAAVKNQGRAATIVQNIVIGSNAVAVDAAGLEAERRGYSHAMTSARESEGLADSLGQQLAEIGLDMRKRQGPDCLVSGGEPVVRLAPAAERGRGGRNQQLALAALERLAGQWPSGVLVLSGGTDGEDGPTDAAGAWVDDDVMAQVRAAGFDVAEHLRRNDAYPVFEAVDGLIKTGPTHTNVCDLRVVLVDRIELAGR